MLCGLAELLRAAAVITMLAIVLCLLPELFELLEPLEQPESVPMKTSIKTTPTVFIRRHDCLPRLTSNNPGRRAKGRMSAGKARAAPPVRLEAVAACVVLTTSVDEAVCPAERLMLPGVNSTLMPCGRLAALRETLPLNVLLAVKVSVVVAICPALRESVGGVLVNVKAGETAVTVTLAGAAWELGLKFASPEYTAVMEPAPTGSEVVDSEAAPPLNAIVPSAVPPDEKVTVPVGVGLPEMLGAIVAVSKTGLP